MPSPWLFALVCLWWAWRLLAAQAVVAGALGGRWDLDAMGLGLLVDVHVLVGLGLLRRAAVLTPPVPATKALDVLVGLALAASLVSRALVGYGAAIQGAWPNERYWQLLRDEPSTVAAQLATVGVLALITLFAARGCLRRDAALLSRHVSPDGRQRTTAAFAGVALMLLGALAVPALAERLQRPARVDLSQSAEALVVAGW